MPGLATAGSVNVSLHFEARLRGGATRVELNAYKGTSKGALPQSTTLPAAFVDALAAARSKSGRRLPKWPHPDCVSEVTLCRVMLACSMPLSVALPAAASTAHSP